MVIRTVLDDYVDQSGRYSSVNRDYGAKAPSIDYGLTASIDLGVLVNHHRLDTSSLGQDGLSWQRRVNRVLQALGNTIDEERLGRASSRHPGEEEERGR